MYSNHALFHLEYIKAVSQCFNGHMFNIYMYFLVNLWTTFLQWEKARLTLHSHLKQASLGLVRKTCPMSVLEQLYPTTERMKYWWISRTYENSYLIILYVTQYNVLYTIKSPVAQQFRWSKAWNLAQFYTLICFHILLTSSTGRAALAG